VRDRDLFCQTGFGPVEAILVELLRRLAAPRFWTILDSTPEGRETDWFPKRLFFR
jgi:hypothetical protein